MVVIRFSRLLLLLSSFLRLFQGAATPMVERSVSVIMCSTRGAYDGAWHIFRNCNGTRCGRRSRRCRLLEGCRRVRLLNSRIVGSLTLLRLIIGHLPGRNLTLLRRIIRSLTWQGVGCLPWSHVPRNRLDLAYDYSSDDASQSCSC